MTKKPLINVLALALLLCDFACASTKHTLAHSPRIPAAQGVVYIEKTKNDNTKISLSVKHLAYPKDIDPSKNFFVVWVTPQNREEAAQNVGALKVDKDLIGSLDTVVPFDEFKLSITAESSPTMLHPSGDPLLWTDVTRK